MPPHPPHLRLVGGPRVVASPPPDVPRSPDERVQHALSRMAAGEPGAAGELFDVVCRPVFTLALAITGSSTAAQDVAVEAFSEIWLTCPARPAGAGSGWVFDVVCRCARSRRGRSGRPMGQDRPRLVPTA